MRRKSSAQGPRIALVVAALVPALPASSGCSSGARGSGGATSSSESGSSATGSGSSGAGGAGGAGDAGGDAAMDGNVTHVVGACSSLPAPGTWENITPPQLDSSQWCVPGSMGCPNGPTSTYGAHYFAIDPNNSGTIYLGTSSLGLWKTTDCGATWTHVNVGANGALLDQGRNWTIAIDPTNSQVLYTCAGYGPSGVFKSVNGGVDWEQILTAEVQPSLIYGGFIEKITLDPTNHQHLLVSFHGVCKNAPVGGGDWGCLAESSDAGNSWTLTNSPQLPSEGDGQTMVDAKTWFFGNGGGGIWRTTNGGVSWSQVYSGEGGGSVFTAKDGTYYVVGGQAVLHSADGVNWTALPGSSGGGSVNGSTPIAGTGTTLFVSGGAYGGTEPAAGWYSSASEANPMTWTPVFNVVPMVFGGSNLAYDPDHHLLYSSNLTSGFWRVVVP
jgi:hypothetical protein